MASISLPFHRPARKASRQASREPRDGILLHVDHFIGIDVGTGSARACIIDAKGDIVGLASENIGLWQPQTGYYVCATSYTSLGVTVIIVLDRPS